MQTFDVIKILIETIQILKLLRSSRNTVGYILGRYEKDILRMGNHRKAIRKIENRERISQRGSKKKSDQDRDNDIMRGRHSHQKK